MLLGFVRGDITGAQAMALLRVGIPVLCYRAAPFAKQRMKLKLSEASCRKFYLCSWTDFEMTLTPSLIVNSRLYVT